MTALPSPTFTEALADKPAEAGFAKAGRPRPCVFVPLSISLRDVLFRALLMLALFGPLGACEAVMRLPSQVGELGSRVGGWFSFGGADETAIAADPHLIVLPLAGTDWLGRSALAEEIARLLRATTPNARAGTAANGRARTLAGQVELVEEGDAVVWLEIVWTYRGSDGRAISEHRQIAAMDRKLWDRAAPAAVQMIASEVAPKAAALLRDETPRLTAARAERTTTNRDEIGLGGEVASNRPAAGGGFFNERGLSPAAPGSAPPPRSPSAQGWTSPGPTAGLPPAREIASAAPVAPVQGSPLSAAWTNPVILIKSVDGAPGDGNQALMLAIKQSLRVRDFMVTEDPRQAVFLIEGRVEIAPPTNGRQRARVVWTVTTVSGGQVGRAIQENAIPAGSLNGAWGQVATMVANAAADGVEELFGRPSTRRAQAVVPPTPPLPQVPGRAPPPR
ncbi:MAG: hypothetical protein AAB223_02405 [Pseudomonadota bacterium]